MIKCPNCNSELSFNVDSQLVTCEYCRSTFNPHNLEIKTKKAQEQTYEGKSYLCSQCGAELLTFDETAITFCSYCGSQAMIESRMIKHNNPDFIIPFTKTKEECISSYKNKISKFLFAPKYMTSDIIINKFRGIYIPYCIYKLTYKGKSVNTGSKYKYRSGDYEYYDKYNIYADVDAEYDGISYDLVSNFYDKFSHSIPFNFKTVEKFNPNYLAGFYADVADVDNSLYEKNVTLIADEHSTNNLKKQIEYAENGCLNPTIRFKVAEKRVGMFPIYFLAIRDKKNKYVNYAVVNGQTGKIAVDLPIDFIKYILISLLLTVPIFLLINKFIVFTPIDICIFSIMAAIISLIISISQLNEIRQRENHLDDIGYIGKTKNVEYKIKPPKKTNVMLLCFIIILFHPIFFLTVIMWPYIKGTKLLLWFIIAIILIILAVKKNNRETKIEINIDGSKFKVSAKEKLKYYYKSVLSILIGIVALILNFVDDIYYYGAALIMFCFVVWSFNDLIKGHNLLVSTKLPQLEKRGGDENE